MILLLSEGCSLVAFLRGNPAGPPIIQRVKRPSLLRTDIMEGLHQASACLRLSRQIREAKALSKLISCRISVIFLWRPRCPHSCVTSYCFLQYILARSRDHGPIALGGILGLFVSQIGDCAVILM